MLSVFWRQDFVLCASWGLYKGRGLGLLGWKKSLAKYLFFVCEEVGTFFFDIVL